jgi:uncharacterized protein (TIGR02646 family)
MLETNLGPYCSYCERPVDDEFLDVEHVQPKSWPEFAALEFSWDNFLLSCKRCNGADNKSNQYVDLHAVLLPHLHNTLWALKYGEGGLIQINERLIQTDQVKARALLNLVGIDKRPGHTSYKPKDKRWLRRRAVWELANKYHQKYIFKEVDVEVLMDLAISRGFWSVWFYVFIDCFDVRLALLQAFPGTNPYLMNDFNSTP